MSYILGISGFHHDATAALVKDGQPIASAEEERFTRVKYQEGFPAKSIQYCLREARIGIQEVDHIVYANNLWGVSGLRKMLHYLKNFFKAPVYTSGFTVRDLYTRLWITFLMRNERHRGAGRAALHFCDHHMAHMASTFLVSPYDKAAILSLDSMGDGDSGVLAHGTGTKIRRLATVRYPNSIPEVYCCVTNYLGFRTQDEYKVMGLASYGEPRYYDKFRKLVEFRDDGTYAIDKSYFVTHYKPGRYAGYVSEKFVREFGPLRQPDEEITERHKDLAASLQKVYEETVFHMLRHLHRLTGETRLCLAGGGALNSVANGKIPVETPFREVYVPPAPGDAGGALGAAFFISNCLLKEPRSFELRTAYWGPGFTEEEIRKALDEAKLTYRRSDHVAKDAAALLAEGNILGWFQGRMELGARALGSRSILADPTRAEMTDIVNKYVKHREDFRPFAPSVLKDRSGEFFADITESPFMTFVCRARKDKAHLIPAVVHVDGTARLQTVEQDVCPLYYELILEFEKLRGVPVILNTSFNVKGEPIVCTPRDAIRCYYSTGIDCLVMGPYILVKNPRK